MIHKIFSVQKTIDETLSHTGTCNVRSQQGSKYCLQNETKKNIKSKMTFLDSIFLNFLPDKQYLIISHNLKIHLQMGIGIGTLCCLSCLLIFSFIIIIFFSCILFFVLLFIDTVFFLLLFFLIIRCVFFLLIIKSFVFFIFFVQYA